jgi:hypothetical protein
MNKKLIYMNFPVSFLEGAFENIKETVDNIMDYAVYKHSQNLDFGTELERMKSASSFFNITFGNIENSIAVAKKSMRTKNLKTPNVSINIDILWDYYKNPKNEFDIACFCAFCAIKSIIGNNEYAKTNKSLIIARMFGLSECKEPEQAPETFSAASAAIFICKRGGNIGVNQITGSIRSGELRAEKQSSGYVIQKNDLIKWATEHANLPVYATLTSKLKAKYSTRYHIDNVLLNLQTNWGLKLYSDHSRGFFLSFSKSLEELAILSIEKKVKSKAKLLSEERAKAKAAALKKLGLK